MVWTLIHWSFYTCYIIFVLYTVEILLYISRNRTAVPISPICIKISVRSLIDWTLLDYFYHREGYHPSVDRVIVQPSVDRVVQWSLLVVLILLSVIVPNLSGLDIAGEIPTDIREGIIIVMYKFWFPII